MASVGVVSGTLYGVGVGPGDPELMTLKAARILASAEVLSWARDRDGASRAFDAIADLPLGATERIPVDMPSKSDDDAEAAWDDLAAKLDIRLAEGRDVAFACLGDPLLYGSFAHLARRLRRRPMEAIAGVTSISAAAARILQPPAMRDESLAILPSSVAEEAMRETARRADGVVFLKVGPRLERIRRVAADLGLAQNALLVENVGRPDERVASLADVDRADYFSLVSARRVPWLSDAP